MKQKYIFGSVIIAVFLGLLVFLFTQSNIKYESNFGSIIASGKTVKAAGVWVKEKKYEADKISDTFSFYMKDETGAEMKVVCKGSAPNNFETATSVVVTGKFEDGYFHATNILTKCPSKYQDQLKTKV